MTDFTAMQVPQPISSAEEPDEAIIERVLGGDSGSFERLMRRYNQRVFRAARSIVRDDAEAEDVAQEAWVRAFVHLDQFAGAARFSTWLLRICVHEALARVRRRARETDWDPLDDESPPMTDHTPEHTAHDRELAAAIERAIDELPTAWRVAFTLRVVEGLSGAETAAVTGIREETVKTRLFRARAQLQHLLADHEDAARVAFAFAGHRCDRMVAGVLARIREIVGARR